METSLRELEEKYGLYAIKVHGKESMLLVNDCKEIHLSNDGSVYYIPHNNRNFIPIVERPFIIPFHAILAYAFNEKPKENEVLDDISHRT